MLIYQEKEYRQKKPSKNKPRTPLDDKKRLIILEFLYRNPNGGSAHFLQKNNGKLRAQDGTEFKILLETMIEKNWIEKKSTISGDTERVDYIISEDGKKVLETIKKLKEEDNPLGKLTMFDMLD